MIYSVNKKNVCRINFQVKFDLSLNTQSEKETFATAEYIILRIPNKSAFLLLRTQCFT